MCCCTKLTDAAWQTKSTTVSFSSSQQSLETHWQEADHISPLLIYHKEFVEYHLIPVLWNNYAFTFSVMSRSQESILSVNRSSVLLPWLDPNTLWLAWNSWLQGESRHPRNRRHYYLQYKHHIYTAYTFKSCICFALVFTTTMFFSSCFFTL